jgi:hypothetical protein
MVLNNLKKIRDELKESAKSYDEAFKNTAIIAAESLASKHQFLEPELNCNSPQISLTNTNSKKLQPILTKKYFIEKYGNLKNTKEAYKKVYGQKSYGRSWQDFLTVAAELPLIEQPALTLEQRVTRIENILKTLGYEL